MNLALTLSIVADNIILTTLPYRSQLSDDRLGRTSRLRVTC
jgi:hypothetical protein